MFIHLALSLMAQKSVNVDIVKHIFALQEMARNGNILHLYQILTQSSKSSIQSLRTLFEAMNKLQLFNQKNT